MAKKNPTGVKGLDKMLDGGLYSGSICVIKGAPGTGKSSFGIEFIARGIEQFSENGLIVTFEHFPASLYRDGQSVGFDLRKMEKEGKLKILFTSPEVFMSYIEELDGEFDRMIIGGDIKRIFVDSINHLERLTDSTSELREKTYSFLNGLRRNDVTCLVAQEDTSITGDITTLEYGLSFIVDTIIQLRYVEINSQVEKAILVLKQRASEHDNKIRQFEITSKGINIEAEFKGQEGLLSGSPRKAAAEFFGG